MKTIAKVSYGSFVTRDSLDSEVVRADALYSLCQELQTKTIEA